MTDDQLGFINLDGNEGFVGSIVDVSWHHVCLDSDKVKQIYLDGVQLKDGDIIEDKSGNEHHGVFNG